MEGEDQVKDIWKKSNMPTILLSVLLSISLWTVVQLTSEKPRQQPIYNVPVRIENEQTLFTNTGFSVIEGKEATIRVDLEARGTSVAELNKKNMEDIYAVADVQAITEPGRTKVRYTLQYPTNLGITVRSSTPRLVEVWVDEIVTREIPVEPYVEGAPADGYLYDSLTPDHETVTVEGPAQVVEQISYARATLAAEGATGSLTDAAGITFVNREGEFMDAEENHLSIVSEGVNLSLNVIKEGIVPLVVDIIEAPGLTAGLATVDIQPSSVKVRGEPSLVDRLTQEGIAIGTVNLGSAIDSRQQAMAIRLPDGISTVAGEPHSATVSVTFAGVSTKTIEVTDITIDLGEAEGWDAILLTASVPVTVRGPSAAVDGLTADDLQAVVRVDPEDYQAGTHTVRLDEIVFAAADSGAAIIDSPETVNIMLRQSEGEGQSEGEEPPDVSDGPETGETAPASGEAGNGGEAGTDAAKPETLPEGEAVE